MRNHSSVIFVLIIVSSHKLLSFAGGLTFLEKSEEIVNQLLLCSGDVFLHLPFAQQAELDDLSKSISQGSRFEFAYSEPNAWINSSWEVQGWRDSNSTSSRMTSPSCWLIIVPATMEPSTVQILNQLIVKISARLRKLSHRVKKPTIVVAIPNTQPQIVTELQSHLLFHDAQFSLNTNVFSLFINSDSDAFSLWEVYNIKLLMKVEKVIDGYTNGKMLPWVKSPAGRRTNFYNESFTAVIRTNQPDWMRYKGSAKAGNITLTGGFSVELYWNFQMMLNFRVKVVTGDGLTTLPNKTLGGTTATHLNSETGDIALSMSSVVPFRASQLTFLQPTYHGIITCFFMQPTANSIRNIVTAPFHTYVWFSLIGTWLFLITVVKISAFLKSHTNPTTREKTTETKQIDPNVNNDGGGGEFESHILDFGWTLYASDYNNWVKDEFTTEERRKEIPGSQETLLEKNKWQYYDDLDSDTRFASEIGMWAFTANCQKSWHIIPDSLPMRMMFLIGILCGVVCFVGYSGAITSTLTVSTLPVKQFSDLMKFKFLFTVHEWSEPFQIFLQLMIDTQSLSQKVLKITTVEEISHLLNANKPMAFLTYSDLFYPTALALNYTEIFICSHISKVQVSPVLYKSGMFLKKGSEYTEILNHKIIIMKERGFNHRYIRTYETNNIFPCGGASSSTADPIEFTDVLTAFLVACSGLLVSVTLLGIEILYSKLDKVFRVKKH